ncbi:MAG TPA: HNH endonuclease signature motif containing protein [Methanofastidiosum sp.]|nr:HNH endonuclease signature motif containing protein [Methanofastidiosum sp.]
MELNGNYCSICKEKEWMGKPIPLVFDHIDGNASNWNLDNCRLICPNCDHQLPTFAGRNSGKGRKYRKKYYTAPVR